MNTRPVLSLVALASAMLIANVSASAATMYEDAEVLSSTPIYHIVEVSSPQQQCWQEDVVRHDSRSYERSATPGILGAVIGGALGNAVGHHKTNKQIGAVVGAILGGSIGSNIGRENANRRADTYIETVERCKTVRNTSQEEKLVGYDVLYSYNGAEHLIRMDEDPGASVRVRVDVEPVR